MRALQLLDDRKLEITDIPEPEAPGPGEVTLRIHAVALNHIDVWGFRGMAFAKREMPLIVGAEAVGEVVAVGPGGRDESGKLIPIDLKVGDKVLFGKWSGTEVKLNGEDLLIMKESDIMGILEGSATAKKAA